jgi:hypothetical protein
MGEARYPFIAARRPLPLTIGRPVPDTRFVLPDRPDFAFATDYDGVCGGDLYRSFAGIGHAVTIGESNLVQRDHPDAIVRGRPPAGRSGHV